MPSPTHPADHRYDPWIHASWLRVRIEHRPLPSGVLGLWQQCTRTVVLADRLTATEQRSTLAHELVHAERGDEPCATAWHEDKQELTVEAMAARRLILIEDLALALMLYEHEVDQAAELDVDLMTLRTRLAGLTHIERQVISARTAVARMRPRQPEWPTGA